MSTSFTSCTTKNNPNHRHEETRWGKRSENGVEQQRSFCEPSTSSAAAPAGYP